MLSRIVPALAAVLLFTSVGSAQTVRFDTNVGNFDVVLNPGEIPELQGHVDNFLQYVEGGHYDNLLLNRADDRNPANGNDGNQADDFVLQFGRFRIDSIFQPSGSSTFIDNRDLMFPSVFVDGTSSQTADGTVDFDTTGLSNTRGTISLALSGTNSNSGTSEFFINLGDNSMLDPQVGPGPADFVTFAMVPDMTTIDLIFRLNNETLIFDNPNPLIDGAFTDVALLDNGSLVYVERAFVLGGAPVEAAGALSAIAVVPEPPTLVLAAGALMLVSLLSRRKVSS